MKMTIMLIFHFGWEMSLCELVLKLCLNVIVAKKKRED